MEIEEKEKELQIDNKKLLIFPKWDEKIKYIFIFIICSLMRRLIPRIIDICDFAKLKESNFKLNNYFNLMTNFISDFSVGIILLINKIREHYSNRETYKIVPPTAIKANMKKYFFILFSIIAIIDFIAQFCMFIFSYFDPDDKILKERNEKTIIKEEDLYFVVFIDIISRYIFSKFILKGHFYKHHILAIIITGIGFIPFIIINIINLIKSYKNENNSEIHHNIIIYLALYILMTIIYSLEDVLNKICLNKLIIKPFELMFYKAIFQIIFIVPLTIFVISEEDISGYFRTNKINNKKLFGRILYRFSFIICNIFRTWSLITIIQLVNPNHLSILKSSEFAALFLIFPIFKYCKELTNIKISEDEYYHFNLDTANLISGIICFLISLIGSAIHNEIIIINRCGFYECTDFYKIEIKKNEDLDFIDKDDKNSVNRESLPEDSSSQLTESFY